MAEHPFVSVIIPTYNRAGTIVRAVDSVLAQGYPNLEVLVVDDGSRDDTEGVVGRAYAGRPEVRYLKKENGGVCTARNTGLREARGELVAMLDSDDYWLPGKLALQVEILKRHPEVGLLWTEMDAIDEDGKVTHRAFLRTYYGAYRFFPSWSDLLPRRHRTPEGVEWYSGDMAQELLLGNMIHTSTVLARADRLAAAGWYDQSAHPSEDQDFYYRVCRTGPVGFIDAVTIHYQFGAADAMTARSRYFEIATSSLLVFERILREEEGRLRIDRALVEEQRGRIHAEIGAAAFQRGMLPLARTHLLRRLKGTPGDLRTLSYLVLSVLPFPLHLYSGLRAIYRGAKALRPAAR